MFEIKEQYGDKVYVIDFPDGLSIPFKLLSLKDFNSCRTSLGLGSVAPNEVYTYIYKTCVLHAGYRDNPDELRAGIPDTLSKLIFYLSGPSDINLIDQLLGIERQVCRTVESQMKIQICRVFSGYTMDMLEASTFPELVKLFAEAESVLLDTGQLKEPFKILTSTEPQTKDGKFSVEAAQQDNRDLSRV